MPRSTSESTPPETVSRVEALVFDVFGTVVDWRGSIIAEGQEFGRVRGIDVDWGAFAGAWRAMYAPSMNRVRRGEIPWHNLDALHRMSLDDLLIRFGIAGLSDEEKDHLNRVWHRLNPWPDAVAGLTRLRAGHVLATLSNGNVALLTNMAKRAGLPWDCILSAELFRAYKPDAVVYESAAALLGHSPDKVMMVAAHPNDLRAARDRGLRTAYVYRPLEFGPERKPEFDADPSFDVVATDFIDLASKLGA